MPCAQLQLFQPMRWGLLCTMMSIALDEGDGENWLAPGGGHGCRLKEGGGGLGNGHL